MRETTRPLDERIAGEVSRRRAAWFASGSNAICKTDRPISGSPKFRSACTRARVAGRQRYAVSVVRARERERETRLRSPARKYRGWNNAKKSVVCECLGGMKAEVRSRPPLGTRIGMHMRAIFSPELRRQFSYDAQRGRRKGKTRRSLSFARCIKVSRTFRT